jgi:hypothetical protein
VIVSIAVNWRKQGNALIELNLGAAERIGIGKRAGSDRPIAAEKPTYQELHAVFVAITLPRLSLVGMVQREKYSPFG